MTRETPGRGPNGWVMPRPRPWMTRRRWLTSIALVALLLGVLVTWSAWTGGFGIAARIRGSNSDLIRRVDYHFSIMGDLIQVYLVPGATRAQGQQVWCGVIRPAAGSAVGDLSPHIDVWSSDPPKAGVNGLLADSRVTCPP
jgi:hypothetical protein